MILFFLGIYDPESPDFGKYALRPNTSKPTNELKVVTSVSNVSKQLEFKISSLANDNDQDHMDSPADNDKP